MIKTLYSLCIGLAILLTIAGCADPKQSLIDQHEALYAEYIKDINNLASAPITAESADFLNALHTLSEAKVKELGKTYRLQKLMTSYYHSVQKDGQVAVDFMSYVATLKNHPLSYHQVRTVIPDQTEVAPQPFVAVYHTTKSGKRLEWFKYEKAGETFELDLVFALRQIEQQLEKEVKAAVADYADLDVASYLKNRYDKTNAEAVDQAIVAMRKDRLAELSQATQN